MKKIIGSSLTALMFLGLPGITRAAENFGADCMLDGVPTLKCAENLFGNFC